MSLIGLGTPRKPVPALGCSVLSCSSLGSSLTASRFSSPMCRFLPAAKPLLHVVAGRVVAWSQCDRPRRRRAEQQEKQDDDQDGCGRQVLLPPLMESTSV